MAGIWGTMGEHGTVPKGRVDRLLDWIDQQGPLKIFWGPVSILAAIGGALSFVGNNWLTFLAVIGCGLAFLATSFYFLQRRRMKDLKSDVRNLNAQVAELREAGIGYRKDLEVLKDVAGNARWASEMLNLCCSSSSVYEKVSKSPMKLARSVRASAQFSNLEPKILDCCHALLGPTNYRLTLYYGNNKRLEPLFPVRWEGVPPTYIASGTTDGNEVVLPDLFNALRKKEGGAYIDDVDHPTKADEALLKGVSEKHLFKYFACYAIKAIPSGSAARDGLRDIMGALILQVARPGPLEGALQDDFFPLLGNLLAAGYLVAASSVPA